jgi:hypothetical protein
LWGDNFGADRRFLGVGGLAQRNHKFYLAPWTGSARPSVLPLAGRGDPERNGQKCSRT